MCYVSGIVGTKHVKKFNSIGRVATNDAKWDKEI